MVDIKGKVDFAIITIRRDEFEAVLQRFNTDHIIDQKYNISRITANNSEQYTCATVRLLLQGNQQAQAAANAIIEDLDPRCILIVGIAGGIPSKDFTLGDVILSSMIYDLTVAAENADGSVDYDIRPGYVHQELQPILANLRDELVPGWNTVQNIGQARPMMDPSAVEFDPGIDEEWRKKVSESLKHHFGPHATRSVTPLFRDAPIASSDRLIRNASLIRDWRHMARRIEAVEMEAAGVYIAAQRRERTYPVLAIRGISDIIGLRRGDDWLGYACHSAAAFTLGFVAGGFLTPVVQSRSASDPKSTTTSGPKPVREDQVSKVSADTPKTPGQISKENLTSEAEHLQLEKNMPTSLAPSIVRIYSGTNKIIGAGFLVTDRQLVTCAHVIADALNYPEKASAIPVSEITLDFPMVAPQQRLKAKVAVWYPVGSTPPLEDIAVLDLEGPLPAGAEPVILRSDQDVFGHGLQICGFPEKYDMGVYGEGKARAINAYGWLQIGDPQSTGYFVKPGFSGSPVWDVDQQGIIAMVVARDKTRGAREAWCIPASTILGVLPTHPLPSSPIQPIVIQPPGTAFDPDWYLSRLTEERYAVKDLNFPGKPINVFGPRRYGKTWFLHHMLDWMRTSDPSCRTVLINLYEFNESILDSHSQVLQQIASRILSTLGMPQEWVSEAWSQPTTVGDSMKDVVERILRATNFYLVLALDKADTLLDRSYQEDFFGMLRSWCEWGYSEPWARLRIMTAVSTTPSRLSRTPRMSSFYNLGMVDLRDLNESQVGELALRYGIPWSSSDLSRLMQMVGGHPYLVRQAMSTAAIEGKSLGSVLADSTFDNSAFARYLQERLYFLRQNPDLDEAMHRVLANPQTRLDLDTYARLRSAGYLDQTGNTYYVPYQILETYLREWL